MFFHKTPLKLVKFFIFWIAFTVLNIFFYSFITIGLYKFICYDSNYLNNLIDISYSHKNTILFYYSKEVLNILLLGLDWYKCTTSCFFIFNDLNIYFNIIYNIKINIFFYSNNFISVTKNDLNLVFLNFYIRSSNLNWINSISLQKTIILNLNESGLFFFRIYNPSHLNVKLITLYMIYPNIITLYINKIQCFCFNVIFLYPLEIVDLPVLIYINPFFSILDSYYLNNIIIYYIIFLN